MDKEEDEDRIWIEYLKGSERLTGEGCNRGVELRKRKSRGNNQFSLFGAPERGPEKGPGLRIPDSGVQIPVFGFRKSGSGFLDPDSWVRIPEIWVRISRSGFLGPDSGNLGPDSKFRNSGSVFQIPGSGFRIPESGFLVRIPNPEQNVIKMTKKTPFLEKNSRAILEEFGEEEEEENNDTPTSRKMSEEGEEEEDVGSDSEDSPEDSELESDPEDDLDDVKDSETSKILIFLLFPILGAIGPCAFKLGNSKLSEICRVWAHFKALNATN
ncbi:Protein CBG17797 [Caenorhabditis briggsae]|uniref:Protein CBG17797 n=1 Tax=Caenorhabditis briggsae TaxID=6238 RepID=A8XRT9_CAEBR|nr:Protein CBG17797 [Caenorhabditis briggsae]CAP35364.1 Protein CBG17797 [Caenorhabditis briggsae]